ncbi:FAD-dependent oxidoreductase [Agromyces sp. Leaf222]|uniref:FAD-dependent oxidoreductase n=1 Tax=Agromyces sp. Leaf222 TaxID=1735688 RepID=UPI0006F911E3|nr:FAD-dependent oxidoreductase [Agromyces sp. Leaf222]KQM81956.1 FAD-dependent oxidoreductase [Agromyces sp. Leaf222]
MTSLWLARPLPIETDDPTADGPGSSPRVFDEIVVGAGLTGLVTAVLLARAGRRVGVLEAREVGAVATGNTTAKLSVLQGAHLQRVRRRTSADVLRAYVDANLAGQTWLLDYLAERGVPVQRRDAVSFAATPSGREVVEREAEVARDAGLRVMTDVADDVPFRTYAPVRLAGQAQFDPMEVLAALAAELRALGGVIRTGVRMTGARVGSPVRVRTTGGEFTCERLVIATGTPILDRGPSFAKLRANRSYAAAYRTDAALPQAMYLSVDEPARSIRTAPDPDLDAGAAELLLVGGYGHEVGRHPSPQSRVDALDDWARTTWPDASLTHRWSAQDYETPHGVPFVGWLPRGGGRVFLATGYDKWGMTNAVQCGLTLAADLLGDLPDWARTLRHRFTTPVALGVGIGMNAAVAKHYAVGWGRALVHRLPAQAPVEGAGVIGRAGRAPVPTAVSTVDGVTCEVSGICPHLGAVLAWNDAERTWDCPAHASRFSSGGALLEGPAKRDLRVRGVQVVTPVEPREGSAVEEKAVPAVG